jgi:UDP-N-acetylglucosamine 1-carboxyvinyltransferase
MDSFRIQGGRRLAGRIQVEGSKNASLPLMAAALCTDGEITLRNVPCLSDISNMARLLRELGVQVDGDCGTIKMRVMDHNKVHAHYDIVKTMRASICVLGPLLARRRRAVIAMPGGCAFGSRPIDLHIRGMQALGAKVEYTGGDIIVTAPDGLRGTTIFLGGPNGSTVLGTANVMCAAALAKGRTVIECAACEPEVVDLANLLNKMGARIEGAGGPRLVIHGVEQLGSADHTIIPDRIVAGTYAVAAAVTNGDVILEEFPYDCMLAVVDRFNEIGVHCELIEGHDDPMHGVVRVTSERTLRPTQITTQPHPGFPTDLQAQFMTLLCLATGNSIVTEKIYPERFMHVAELSRMGAQIHRQGPTCVVTGGTPLRGAPVMASDLRASACLVLAGLAAEGETNVSRIYHLDRGYARMEEQLNVLGARIERVREDSGVKTGAGEATPVAAEA